MNNLGCVCIDNATYQFSRSSAYCFWRRRFFQVFTIYGHGGHVGHVTQLICINFHSHTPLSFSGEPGLVDRVLPLHTGSRGFDSHQGHMSERFFRSNRPGYPHPVSSELENSGMRVAVGDCRVTELRRWRPPYQTGKTVHVHAKHYKHNEDGRTAPGVCGNGFVPLSHSGNAVTRIGIHTHTHTHTLKLSYELWF